MARLPVMPCALAAVLATAWAGLAFAAPPGYRYIGSRVVSQGRVVLWYWNSERLEVDSGHLSFVARLYARAPDVDQERTLAAIVRCDSKTYRDADSRGPYAAIDDDEPIGAVWRAGCADGKVLDLAQRSARLNGSGTTRGTAAAVTVADAQTRPAAEAPAPTAVQPAEPAPPAAARPAEAADPRRADACVKFAEVRSAPAGEATISNACAFPVEVTLCYKGSSGPYACGSSPRGRYGDSLSPGATHVLPEYRRGTHRGITAVACRGTLGSVFPRLNETAGKAGCE